MAAGIKDFLDVEQGADFEHTLTWLDSAEVEVPLAGFVARMQVRPTVESEDVLVELTTENSRIELTDPGIIYLHIDAATMDGIDPGSWKYDLELESGSGRVTRLLKGKFKVSAQVTREL